MQHREPQILRLLDNTLILCAVLTASHTADTGQRLISGVALRLLVSAAPGYTMGEVVGRNARFMQGPDSDPEAIAELRDAVRRGRATVVELINLRKDGTRFWNQARAQHGQHVLCSLLPNTRCLGFRQVRILSQNALHWAWHLMTFQWAILDQASEELAKKTTAKKRTAPRRLLAQFDSEYLQKVEDFGWLCRFP